VRQKIEVFRGGLSSSQREPELPQRSMGRLNIKGPFALPPGGMPSQEGTAGVVELYRRLGRVPCEHCPSPPIKRVA